MTKPTLSRSAKATPKTDEKRDTNGTPLIDHNSGTISVPLAEDRTGWTIQFANGSVQHVRVKGGRGRISFSGARSTGEVRIYRNETTKVFDAVFTGVTAIVSDRVETIPVKDGVPDTTVPKFGKASTVGGIGGTPLGAWVNTGPAPTQWKTAEEEDVPLPALNPEDLKPF